MKTRFPRTSSNTDGPWIDIGIGGLQQTRDRLKIATELREKYAQELRTAPLWKRWLIAFRISRETARPRHKP
jgi:hypothetical protein